MSPKKNTPSTRSNFTALHKVQVNCRVSPLAKKLIKLEQRHFESEGQAVEALVLRASTSPEAHALILEEAKTNPLISALKDALYANMPDKSARAS